MQARLSGQLRWWEDLWTPSTFQRHRIAIGESKVPEQRWPPGLTAADAGRNTLQQWANGAFGVGEGQLRE